MSNEISAEDYNFNTEVVLDRNWFKGIKLKFTFSHRTYRHTYTVENKDGETVYQSESLTDACEEFNKLL